MNNSEALYSDFIEYSKGHTIAEVGKHFNFNRQRVYRLRYELGIAKRHNKLTPFQEDELWRLRQEGMGHKKLAKKFGISIYRSKDLVCRINAEERA